MNYQKIQSVSRIAGIALLLIVGITQLFKDQNFISQVYLPYLSILSLILLSISLYLTVKMGGFRQYNLPIKMISSTACLNIMIRTEKC